MHTLLLDTLNDFRSKYKAGIKFISQSSYKLTIDKKTFDLVMEVQLHDNYDLYFSSKGLLKASIHNEKSDKYKINYYYDKQALLTLAVCTKTPDSILHSISEFSYNNLGQIETETCRNYFANNKLDSIQQNIHTYIDNKEVIVLLGHNQDDEYIIYNTYDLDNRLIESMALLDSEEIIYWHENEYNTNGDQIRSITLDNEGNPENTHEFFEFKDGLKSVHFCKSMDSISVDEFHYLTDDKGNWTNRVKIKDGDPRYVYNRRIEYY